MKRQNALLAGMVATVISGSLVAQENAIVRELGAKKPAARPAVEVVFVRDTTGSMRQLIQAAKEKVWAIANTLATAKPTPDIMMGLIGYRDRMDKYVTKRLQLTSDLDAVYEELMKFQANGGGDQPESVNQALHEAVTGSQWSQDDSTLKLIFLVGDAPPHMDYPDDVKYQKSCELAAKRSIYINTIQCGGIRATKRFWVDIAKRAEGRYFRVEQSGGTIVQSTPFDERLASLSLEVDKTRLYWGDQKILEYNAMRCASTEKTKKSSSIRAQAQWAVFNNGNVTGMRNFLGTNELCAAVESGKVDLAKLKKDQLPEKLKKLSTEALAALVDKNIASRKKLQAEIVDLGKKRQAYLEKKLREGKSKDKPALDLAIFECIRAQAATRGIVYAGGPKL